MAELRVNTRRPYLDLGDKSGALTIDASAAETQAFTTTGNVTLTLTGQGVVAVVITNGGGHTVTYGGNPVTVDTTAGASTLVEVWPGGTLVYPGGSGSLDTEGVQDVVGAMIVGAGGTYDDATGGIELPGIAAPPGGVAVFATTDPAVAAAYPQYAWIMIDSPTDPDPVAPTTAPGSLSVAVASANALTATYDAVTDATGYALTIQEGTLTGDPASPTPIDNGTLLQAQLAGLTPATAYTVWVRAYNAAGAGPWSAPVTQTTSATVVAFTDDFERANSSTLGANWIAATPGAGNGLSIADGAAYTGAGGAAKMSYVASSFAADQYIEANVSVLDPATQGRRVILAVRASTNRAGYELHLISDGGGTTFVLYKLSGSADGTDVALPVPAGATSLATGTMSAFPFLGRLQAVGTNIKAWVGETLIVDITDSTHASGKPGIGVYRDRGRIHDVEAGSL